ncbi:MAG: hypothetical protein LUG12_04720 [Erysipelotrichaceae bacterium]|nr:hypothetical protein [Erysipelotrichaceae bacterium]
MQYLYVYNYEIEEKELCEMEFKRLFKETMKTKYYITETFIDYTRSPYIRGRLDIMFMDTSFDHIVQSIIDANLYYLNFKVIYLKNDITHVHYKDSLDKCKAAALPISGSVNMHHPKIIFAITKIDDFWYFGIYHEKSLWNKHMDKPHSYSHSLNLRDARAIVNIAVGQDLNKKIIDPCCGVGTVVLEALGMGLDIKGFDINRYVSYQARLNLEYYGYDPLLIQRKDMREIKEIYDVTILDIPYGIYSPFTYEQQLDLLQHILSNELVLVSHISMNDELEQLNYNIIDQAKINKSNFIRYITYARKENKHETYIYDA